MSAKISLQKRILLEIGLLEAQRQIFVAEDGSGSTPAFSLEAQIRGLRTALSFCSSYVQDSDFGEEVSE